MATPRTKSANILYFCARIALVILTGTKTKGIEEMSEQTELTTEQKKQAIFAAVDGGKVSQAKVYPVGNGGAISRLRKGKGTPAKIDEIYNNLQVVLAGGTIPTKAKAKRNTKRKKAPAAKTSTAHTADTAQQKTILSLQAQVKALEVENARLREQVKHSSTEPQEKNDRLVRLEQRIAQLEHSQAQGAQLPAQTNTQVLGWNLSEKTTRTGGKSYRKWYANRAGHCVYIGNDTHKAEQKIKAYCAKKGLVLCEVDK